MVTILLLGTNNAIEVKGIGFLLPERLRACMHVCVLTCTDVHTWFRSLNI